MALSLCTAIRCTPPHHHPLVQVPGEMARRTLCPCYTLNSDDAVPFFSVCLPRGRWQAAVAFLRFWGTWSPCRIRLRQSAGRFRDFVLCMRTYVLRSSSRLPKLQAFHPMPPDPCGETAISNRDIKQQARRHTQERNGTCRTGANNPIPVDCPCRSAGVPPTSPPNQRRPPAEPISHSQRQNASV